MKITGRVSLLWICMAGVLAPAVVFGADNGKLIEPGSGIGGARLGMTEAQASAALGKPDARLHITDGYVDVFGELRLFVGENAPAFKVETESDAFRTADGLGVGSMEDDIVAKRGKPALAEDVTTRNDNLLMTIGRQLCYEPGLVFVAEYLPRQPHATTRVFVRSDGCARAFGK